MVSNVRLTPSYTSEHLKRLLPILKEAVVAVRAVQVEHIRLTPVLKALVFQLFESTYLSKLLVSNVNLHSLRRGGGGGPGKAVQVDIRLTLG